MKQCGVFTGKVIVKINCGFGSSLRMVLDRLSGLDYGENLLTSDACVNAMKPKGLL